jgi:hypothetical protein
VKSFSGNNASALEQSGAASVPPGCTAVSARFGFLLESELPNDASAASRILDLSRAAVDLVTESDDLSAQI